MGLARRGSMPPSQKRFHRLGLEVLLDEYLAAKFYGLYLFLLLLSFLLSYIAAHRCRCTYLSEAGVTLFVGFAGGGLLQLLVMQDEADEFGEREVSSALVSFSDTVLFCVLLPPIIFHSGYRMRGNFFWANIDKITMLAFAGTLVSSVLVGLLVFAGQGFVSSETLSLAEALTFGALISATDPVTTLAIFEELNVDPHLFNIIFGESVLNDAVAIVLFHIFGKCIGYDGPLMGILLRAATDFAFVFAGSAVAGLLCGCFSALLFKHLQLHVHSRGHGPQLELAIFLVFCYAPYLLAECLSLSGTVAILFTGTSMKRYTYGNLSKEAKGFIETMIGLVSHVAESFIFIDLGTSAWQTFQATPSLVALTTVACLLARAAHVYPIGFFLNSLPMHYPRRRFEKVEMHMVWFSGLRGAIAYALSTQFPGPHRRCVMSLTMAVVLATVWGLGGTTVPMLRHLGIRQMQPGQLRQLSLTLEPFVNRLRVVHWDRQYLRPALVRGVSADGLTAPDEDGEVAGLPAVALVTEDNLAVTTSARVLARRQMQGRWMQLQRRAGHSLAADEEQEEEDDQVLEAEDMEDQARPVCWPATAPPRRGPAGVPDDTSASEAGLAGASTVRGMWHSEPRSPSSCSA